MFAVFQCHSGIEMSPAKSFRVKDDSEDTQHPSRSVVRGRGLLYFLCLTFVQKFLIFKVTFMYFVPFKAYSFTCLIHLRDFEGHLKDI